mgnify:FL=1
MVKYKMVKGVSANCVSCSLANDYLVPINKCRHSSSPIFNRTKRCLWRSPLPEDICDTIYKEAIHKEIINNDTGFLSRYESLVPTIEKNYVYHPEKDLQYQQSNLVGANFLKWKTNYKCSSEAVRVHYRQLKRGRKSMRKLINGITRQRVMTHSTFILKYRDASPIQQGIKDKLNKVIKEYSKTDGDLSDWDELDFTHIEGEEEGSKTKNNIRNLYRIHTESKYQNEVCPVRINNCKRLTKLYNSEPDNKVRMWYLMIMGQLVHSNKYHTENKLSKEYHYLGTYVSHRRDLYDKWNSGFKYNKYLDFPQNIYKLLKYNAEINWRDCYSKSFNSEWRLMLKDDLRQVSPKKLKSHMKKVFVDLYDYHINKLNGRSKL